MDPQIPRPNADSRPCDVNPFEYLQALQKNAQAVQSQAALWLPWNYREQLAHAP